LRKAWGRDDGFNPSQMAQVPPAGIASRPCKCCR
jgi:hypothetical protein